MMIKPAELQGVYVPIITPMRKGLTNALGVTSVDEIDNPIDTDKFYMLIDDLIDAGVAGICVAGTTGQSATLGHEEQIDLIHAAYRYINNRVQFMAGAGSNSTREAIKLSLGIEEKIGPTTLLHITPYYNCPPQDGLYKHFKNIADSVQGNIIMYNVPTRTSTKLNAETAIELSRHPKIIGLKQCLPYNPENIKETEEIIKNTNPENFRLLSGEDKQTTEIIRMGGYGAIAATANIAPKLFVEMVDYALKGDFENANTIQNKVEELINLIFCVKNPIPLAYMFGTNVRLPLNDMREHHKDEVEYIEQVLSRFSPEVTGIDLFKYKEK